MRPAALSLLLALLTVEANAQCPDFPCLSLFPCEHLECIEGTCVNVGVDCNDRDACTIDACDNDRGGCVHDPYCPEDGAVCNGMNQCLLLPPPFHGVRCLSFPLDCNDDDACTIDSCVEPSGCQHVPLDCNDGDPCTADRCDHAVGCAHDAIAGCCRTAADCASDACHSRRCVDRECTSPEPVSCDDGNASTADTCDPVSGCIHTPRTPPDGPSPGDGSCQADADCPADQDPCTTAACDGSAGCVQRGIAGFDSLACVCQRPSPPACSGATLPRKIGRRLTGACVAIDHARNAPEARTRKLVRRAGRQLGRARQTALDMSGREGFPPACGDALAAQLADGVRRADAIRAQ